jgi:hypothetical protein
MLTEGADLQFVVERRALAGAVQRLGHVLQCRNRLGVTNGDGLSVAIPRADAALHDQRLHSLHALGAAHGGERILTELARSRRAGAARQADSHSEDRQCARD